MTGSDIGAFVMVFLVLVGLVLLARAGRKTKCHACEAKRKVKTCKDCGVEF